MWFVSAADHGGAEEVADLVCPLPQVCRCLTTPCHSCGPHCPASAHSSKTEGAWNEGAHSFTKLLEIKPEFWKLQFW